MRTSEKSSCVLRWQAATYGWQRHAVFAPGDAGDRVLGAYHLTTHRHLPVLLHAGWLRGAADDGGHWNSHTTWLIHWQILERSLTTEGVGRGGGGGGAESTETVTQSALFTDCKMWPDDWRRGVGAESTKTVTQPGLFSDWLDHIAS